MRRRDYFFWALMLTIIVACAIRNVRDTILSGRSDWFLFTDVGLPIFGLAYLIWADQRDRSRPAQDGDAG